MELYSNSLTHAGPDYEALMYREMAAWQTFIQV